MKRKKLDNYEIIDPSINGQIIQSKDEGKKSLRIDRNTVILVKPENCNQEYAEYYRANKMFVAR